MLFGKQWKHQIKINFSRSRTDVADSAYCSDKSGMKVMAQGSAAASGRGEVYK